MINGVNWRRLKYSIHRLIMHIASSIYFLHQVINQSLHPPNPQSILIYMGYKNVCFNCQTAQNLGMDLRNFRAGKCPECGKPMIFLNYAFRPPRKGDDKAWQVVAFLVEKGFRFQHIYQPGKSEYIRMSANNYVPYPHTMQEAKEFVEKYKDQARKKES